MARSPYPDSRSFSPSGGSTFIRSHGTVFVSDNNVSESIAPGPSYTQIAIFGQGSSDNARTNVGGSGTITVDEAGTYLVTISMSFRSSANNTIIFGTSFVNEEENHHIHFERKIAAGADVGSASSSGVLSAQAGDVISFRVRHDSPSSIDLTISYGNLTVVRL